MTRVVETRVIRWTAPGYEDSFTQYQVFDGGQVWVTQISLRDNLARKLQGEPSWNHYRTVEAARDVVDRLIRNRADCTEEVVPSG